MISYTRVRIASFFVTLFVTAAVLAGQSGSTIATGRIFEAIGLSAGMTVCEMGAGDGELTIAAATVVGATGRVHTSELGDVRVKALRERTASSGLSQISVVEGDPVKTNFPDAGCDALFMRNVYHHFADPAAINRSIAASLKPGARVAVVDFTPPGNEAGSPADRAKDGMHGVTPETVSRELAAAGLEQVSSEAGTQRWFMVVAKRPDQSLRSAACGSVLSALRVGARIAARATATVSAATPASVGTSTAPVWNN